MPDREHDRFFIGGRWQAAADDQRVDVVSPSTEEVVGRVPHATPADIDRAVGAARAAFDDGRWSGLPLAGRLAAVERLGGLLAKRSDELVALLVDEMGTPASSGAPGQVLLAPIAIDAFLGIARDFAFEEPRPSMMGTTVVRRTPIGVVGGIVPWNAPLMMSLLKSVPALLAGCTVVLKPALEAPLNSFVLAEAVADAGFPDGVLNIVPGGREAGAHLVAHPGVDMVSFTGSTAAGREIASVCGRHLKPVCLELGGKSAAVVLDDADLGRVATDLVLGSLGNNGQQCFALSRVLVQDRRHDELVDAMVATFGALAVGDPHHPETAIGPLISAEQRSRVEGYIESGRAEGATVALGGGRPAGLDRGWYVEPTVFAAAGNHQRIAQEEIFGPVVTVIPFHDEADAVALANDTVYGLSGAVFSADTDRATNVARGLMTGNVNVNGILHNPLAPFGGVKSSGMGREWGPEGMAAFLVDTTINVAGP